MKVEIVGRIIVDCTYRYHQLRAVKRDGVTVIEDVEFDRYRVQGFGFDGRTRQEQVLYVGLEGPDEGRVFCCTPYDFAMKFRLVEPEQAAVPAAKQIDTRSKSLYP